MLDSRLDALLQRVEETLAAALQPERRGIIVGNYRRAVEEIRTSEPHSLQRTLHKWLAAVEQNTIAELAFSIDSVLVAPFAKHLRAQPWPEGWAGKYRKLAAREELQALDAAPPARASPLFAQQLWNYDAFIAREEFCHLKALLHPAFRDFAFVAVGSSEENAAETLISLFFACRLVQGCDARQAGARLVLDLLSLEQLLVGERRFPPTDFRQLNAYLLTLHRLFCEEKAEDALWRHVNDYALDPQVVAGLAKLLKSLFCDLLQAFSDGTCRELLSSHFPAFQADPHARSEALGWLRSPRPRPSLSALALLLALCTDALGLDGVSVRVFDSAAVLLQSEQPVEQFAVHCALGAGVAPLLAVGPARLAKVRSLFCNFRFEDLADADEDEDFTEGESSFSYGGPSSAEEQRAGNALFSSNLQACQPLLASIWAVWRQNCADRLPLLRGE